MNQTFKEKFEGANCTLNFVSDLCCKQELEEVVARVEVEAKRPLGPGKLYNRKQMDSLIYI